MCLCVFSFDLLVCNPPFFSSLTSTGVNPNRSAAATANELVCPGGEEEFVAQMIRESRERPAQIRSVSAWAPDCKGVWWLERDCDWLF